MAVAGASGFKPLQPSGLLVFFPLDFGFKLFPEHMPCSLSLTICYTETFGVVGRWAGGGAFYDDG